MRFILFILILFLSINVFAQGNKPEKECRVIQFIHKDSINSISKINPNYHPRGFLLVENGVYDFVINGKKHFQSILLQVNENKFLISSNWESLGDDEIVNDTLEFPIDSQIQIRMVSVHNGVGGLPTKTKLHDYIVTTQPTKYFCSFNMVDIKSADKTYKGHPYFTEIGYKNIKMVKGKPFLCEERGEYILRRK